MNGTTPSDDQKLTAEKSATIEGNINISSFIFKADELRKSATQHTVDAIENDVQFMTTADANEDFANAQRGLIENNDNPNPVPVVKSNKNSLLNVWNVEPYDFLTGDDSTEAPSSVHDSLWRNANLCYNYGLFEVVAEQVYQVRGYDISNMTFVRGTTGWIAMDPLRGKETAKAAYDFFKRQVKVAMGNEVNTDVSAIIYSHSHIDHFGGAGALIEGIHPEKIKNGNFQIIAPADFADHAISENIIAGTAMGRRSLYQYGNLLTNDCYGAVNIGLGISVSTAETTFILPNVSISETTPKTDPICVDGIDVLFQLTPGTEAPCEMNTYFPGLQKKCLWMAENATNTMHNVLTLRGSQVRDSLQWAKYMQETINLYGNEAEVKFQSHHWPMWDDSNGNIVKYLKKQRDVYKYTHDQTVRLMNLGYIGSEISEMIKLPPSLENEYSIRGYYGSLRHNSRAVYQFYMGWYTSNPSDLNNLPPAESAKQYMRYMNINTIKDLNNHPILQNTENDYNEGNYRWVCEILKQVIYAFHDEAAPYKYERSNEIYGYDTLRNRLADAYEQLGYQSESGPWRNEYLTAAQETRRDVPEYLMEKQMTFSREFVEGMRITDALDHISVSLNAVKVHDYDPSLSWKISFNITDAEEGEQEYYLTLSNCTLNYTKHNLGSVDLAVVTNQLTFNLLLAGMLTEDELESDSNYSYTQTPENSTILQDLFSFLDTFYAGFPIVSRKQLDPMIFYSNRRSLATPKPVVPSKPAFKSNGKSIETLKKIIPFTPAFSSNSVNSKDKKEQPEVVTEQTGGNLIEIGLAAC